MDSSDSPLVRHLLTSSWPHINNDFITHEYQWECLSRYRHTTISLICMNTHKASAARCLHKHQAWSRQPAIWPLLQSPLRRLALSVLFTSWSTTYQNTCTVSERSSIKCTCQCKPTRSSSFALRQCSHKKQLCRSRCRTVWITLSNGQLRLPVNCLPQQRRRKKFFFFECAPAVYCTFH